MFSPSTYFAHTIVIIFVIKCFVCSLFLPQVFFSYNFQISMWTDKLIFFQDCFFIYFYVIELTSNSHYKFTTIEYLKTLRRVSVHQYLYLMFNLTFLILHNFSRIKKNLMYMKHVRYRKPISVLVVIFLGAE